MRAEHVVVVGAGVSGLGAACLLAREGRRVTVLEQHAIPGGLMQRFTRKSIAFDTGFHYVGGAGPGGPLRRYLAHLGVLERIELEPFDPDAFDEVALPRRRVVFPQGTERAAERLGAEFPQDAAGVRRWFAELAQEAAGHPFFSFQSTSLEAGPALRSDGPSVAQRLRETITDPDLAAALSAHCLLYGVSAASAPLESHALVSTSYFHSAHGVRGGGAALSDALVQVLRAAGGELRLRTDVARILVEGRRAVGVTTTDGERIEADAVLSSAHPEVTLDLLGEDAVPARHARDLRSLPPSPGALLVHCAARGIRADRPRRNRFAFRDAAAAERPARPWFAAGKAPDSMALLEAPASASAPHDTVFQVFVPMPVGDLPDLPDRAAWNEHKLEAAGRLLPWVEQVVPEWTGRIEIVDVSTPRAVERFVRSPGGSCFGVANRVGVSGRRKLAPNLGLRGLCLTGQSVSLPGVLGSLVSAYMAVASLNGEARRLYHELRALG